MTVTTDRLSILLMLGLTLQTKFCYCDRPSGKLGWFLWDHVKLFQDLYYR